MTAYLKSVIAVVFCASLLCSLFPKESVGKFASFAAGLVVMTVVLLPLIRLSKGLAVQFSDIPVEELSVRGEDYLEDEFEKTVASRLGELLKEKTGQTFRVSVRAETDKNGDVCGLDLVEIAPYRAEYALILATELNIAKHKVVELE